MLQTMRDNSKGVVSGILVGLLVVIFALTGAEALFTGSNDSQTVLTINGEDVSETDVARAIEQQKRQLTNRFGEQVPEAFLSDDNLRQPAIDSLIRRTLLAQAALDANMTVSEARLNNIITSTEAFQGLEGQFDPARYQQALRMMAYTPSSYRRELIQDVTVRQLVVGVSGSNFVTDAELQYFAELSNQTRDFSFVTLSADALMAEIAPTEAEVSDYYEQNRERFTVPEKVAVEYIDLDVSQLAEAVSIDEAQLRRQYQDNIDSFTPAVERHAAHILLEDPSEAQLAQLQQKLDAGADFAALAKEYSADLGSKGNGGDLGISTGEAFPDAFEDALAELAVGEVSGPVTTEAGTHFIKLLDESGAEPTSFAEQKATLAAQAKRTTAESRFIEILDELEDLSYNAESLASVADQLGLEVAQTEPFTRSGGTGIAAQPAVAKAAFSDEVLVHGNASPVIELAPDRVVVVKTIAHEPSFVQPLAEVKADIITTLKETQAAELLAEKGQSLQQQLRAGVTLAELAQQQGLTLTTAEAVSRANPEQPRSIVEFAFSMARPAGEQPTIDGFGANGEYTVVSLQAVNKPEDELPEAQKQSLAKNLSGLYGNTDLASYEQHLQATASIERK
jgi:peptidyl-prolyl cis-trans isomerase D